MSRCSWSRRSSAAGEKQHRLTTPKTSEFALLPAAPRLAPARPSSCSCPNPRPLTRPQQSEMSERRRRGRRSLMRRGRAAPPTSCPYPIRAGGRDGRGARARSRQEGRAAWISQQREPRPVATPTFHPPPGQGGPGGPGQVLPQSKMLLHGGS